GYQPDTEALLSEDHRTALVPDNARNPAAPVRDPPACCSRRCRDSNTPQQPPDDPARARSPSYNPQSQRPTHITAYLPVPAGCKALPSSPAVLSLPLLLNHSLPE